MLFRVICALILVLLSAKTPSLGNKLKGQFGNRPGKFGVTAEIPAEGSYRLERSGGVFTNWITVTNFNSLPATNTYQENLSGKQGFYRLVRLTVPVAITNQPQGITNYFNQEVRLEVGVTGSWPLRLQWFKDGQPIAGAASNKLIFNGRAEYSGSYSLLASNLWGVAVSTPVLVKTINPVATNLAGRKMNFVIESAQGSFIASGSYSTTFDRLGFYTTTSTNAYLNDTGYWQYAAISETTGRVFLPNSITYPNGTLTLLFQTLTNGQFSLTAPGRAGYQLGKFSIVI